VYWSNTNLTLILRYTLAGNPECHIKPAARIKIDSTGLTLLDPCTGALETLALSRIDTLSILSIR
jgi:hypothetical protein